MQDEVVDGRSDAEPGPVALSAAVEELAAIGMVFDAHQDTSSTTATPEIPVRSITSITSGKV
jgi:hypothetical protein